MGEPGGLVLDDVGDLGTEGGAVASRLADLIAGLGGDDDPDLGDAGIDQRLDPVEEHGLVGNWHQLLRRGVGDRPQPRAGPAGEDQALEVLHVAGKAIRDQRMRDGSTALQRKAPSALHPDRRRVVRGGPRWSDFLDKTANVLEQSAHDRREKLIGPSLKTGIGIRPSHMVLGLAFLLLLALTPTAAAKPAFASVDHGFGKRGTISRGIARGYQDPRARFAVAPSGKIVLATIKTIVRYRKRRQVGSLLRRER